MLVLAILGCTASIDCSQSETRSSWDTGSQTYLGITLADTNGQEDPVGKAYEISTSQPGSLYNGSLLTLDISNQQNSTGRLAIYQAEAPPSQTLLPTFNNNSIIPESLSGLGDLIVDLTIEGDGYNYQEVHVKGHQYSPKSYLTFVISEDSVLEIYTPVEISYCQRSSNYLSGETGGNIELSELW